MQLIKLTSKPNETDWSMQFADDTHYDVLYKEDVKVLKPDGSPLLVLCKKALSRTNVSLAWPALRKINGKTENRSTASGIKSQPRKKQNGTLSKVERVPKGWEVHSAIIGYFERNPRMPYCHACAWNLKNPNLFAAMFPMVQEVDALFKKHVPDRYEVQKKYCDSTSPDFVIPETVFTTLTINKNFRTACHKDAGDLAAGFSCMSVIRQGAFMGGNLVLPNWRIAVELDSYDVVMFDAHEFHGNTQIIPLTENAIRCSIVHYYREKMVHCKSAAEELNFAKNKKLGEKLYD